MRRQKRRGTQFLLTGAAVTLSALLCGKTLPVRAQEMERETTLRYSEVCDTEDALTEPEEYMEEAGIKYRLRRWEIVNVPVTGRQKELRGQLLYYGVGRGENVPQTAAMDVKDEESGQAFETVLPLKAAEYTNERWQDDFQFTATFHRYGSDSYRLGDMEITEEENPFSSEEEKEALLSLIAVKQDEYIIERCRWQGESYEDQAGIMCRDVLIEGKRKVWDCKAVYEGTVKLPDYTRYRTRAEYGRDDLEQEPAEQTAAENSLAEAFEDQRDTGETMAERWRRIMKTGIQLSIGIFLIAAVVFAGKRLAAWAKKLYEEE